MDFVVSFPLPQFTTQDVPPFTSFGLGFLQTPPRDDALALLLAFGSAKTWHGDFHPISSVTCPAHTLRMTGWKKQSEAALFPVLVDAIVR